MAHWRMTMTPPSHSNRARPRPMERTLPSPLISFLDSCPWAPRQNVSQSCCIAREFLVRSSENRSRRGSDVSVRARKLSFNPLPDEWDPPAEREDNIQAVGAFEVPKWKRIRELPPALSYNSSLDVITYSTRSSSFSTGVRHCRLLPLRCRDRVWLRCHKAGPEERGRLSRSLLGEWRGWC